MGEQCGASARSNNTSQTILPVGSRGVTTHWHVPGALQNMGQVPVNVIYVERQRISKVW
jgi:hypothetical protein